MLAKALENIVTFLSKTCKRLFRGSRDRLASAWL